MALPKYIKVHGVRYRLRFVAGKKDDLLSGKAVGVLQWNHEGEPTIRIDRDQTEDEQRATLLHELIHAAGAELSLLSALVNKETITGPLSRYIYGIFKDNPAIARWLLGVE